MLGVVALINAVVTRTATDFLRYPSYIALGLVAVLVLVGLVLLIVGEIRLRRPVLADLGYLLAFPVGIYAAACVYYAVGVSLIDLYRWLLTQDWAFAGTAVLAGTACLGIGAALFYFRLRWRASYGVTEALAGMAVAAYRFTSPPPGESAAALYLALLTAGVYLVVRGLDNVHQGLTKDPIDPLAKDLIARFQARYARVLPGSS